MGYTLIPQEGNRNGMVINTTDDPASLAYNKFETAVKRISWEDFEKLTMSLILELGFCNVQRLSRGSQQGRDIIGIWESRFVLGRRIPFRFQCKHKKRDDYIRKRDLGDSLADFLLQDSDEIFIIITNAYLSNDVIEQIDKASESGVYAISKKQLFRLIASCPQTAKSFLKLDLDICESIRHYFDTTSWIEAICNNKASNDLKITLHRFWTEPYTWFFYMDANGKMYRKWTTFGGDFRLSIQNSTPEVQNVSGLTLHLIKRKPLPEFAVVNTTPKGGENLKKISINLSQKLGTYDLSRGNIYLNPGGFYNCLIDFQPSDPGIYYFQIRLEGCGGSQRIRESDIYSIVALPDPIPSNYIYLHESWPQSLVIVETLFKMSPEERLEKFGQEDCHLMLFRKESGELVIKYSPKSEKNYSVPDMKEIVVDHPLASILTAWGSSKTMGKYFFPESYKDWADEWLDYSEPRAPLHRAERLQSKKADIRLIQDALLKAHERAPWHSKLNAEYAAIYYSLGYRGFAQFYMEAAYVAAPNNPIIAGMHYLLKKALNKQVDQFQYYSQLDDVAKQGFLRLVSLYTDNAISFPKSYWEAAKLAFSDNEELQDLWSNQSW